MHNMAKNHRDIGEASLSLPNNFLGLNHAKLTASAQLMRGQTELHAALNELRGSFWAAVRLNDALSIYGPASEGQRTRHIRRGGLICQALVTDSRDAQIPGQQFHTYIEELNDSLVGTDTTLSDPNIFTEAAFLLMRKDRQLQDIISTPTDQRRVAIPSHGVAESDDALEPRYASELDSMVGSVLDTAGLNEAIVTAIGHFSEPEAGVITDLSAARYGAAVVALGLAR